MIFVAIPGEPCAQGRGIAVAFQRGDGRIAARVVDPRKSRNWKATAQEHMRRAMQTATALRPLDGPLQLRIVAVFTLAQSHWKKRVPVPVQWHVGRPDGDNVMKAVKDAAKGVLWLDDSQVADARIVKLKGAQGQAPGVYVAVQPCVECTAELGVWDLVERYEEGVNYGEGEGAAVRVGASEGVR